LTIWAFSTSWHVGGAVNTRPYFEHTSTRAVVHKQAGRSEDRKIACTHQNISSHVTDLAYRLSVRTSCRPHAGPAAGPAAASAGTARTHAALPTSPAPACSARTPKRPRACSFSLLFLLPVLLV